MDISESICLAFLQKAIRASMLKDGREYFQWCWETAQYHFSQVEKSLKSSYRGTV
jgi:hypothetical protein